MTNVAQPPIPFLKEGKGETGEGGKGGRGEEERNSGNKKESGPKPLALPRTRRERNIGKEG
jgi:hypothetical protein